KAFVDIDASKENFKNFAQDASLIHLALHGELNPLSPNFSKLWFGDNEEESLTVLEIYGLNLNAALAVLSACSSGVGDGKFGDGLLSLARAFSFAGVESTLMSLWEVPDRESEILMNLFYD